jgi:hypothetical protein
MFSAPSKRFTFSRLFRQPLGVGYATASRTPPRGLSEILEKRPEDVVVTFARRTAMGRAKKGQLKDVPVDKLLHSLFRVRLHGLLLRSSTGLEPQATLEKTRLNPSKIDDICVGGGLGPFRCSISEQLCTRNLPPSVPPLYLSSCRYCRRNPTPSPHFYRQPALLLGVDGHSQYRTFHPERGNWSWGCRWGRKHVHEVRSSSEPGKTSG